MSKKKTSLTYSTIRVPEIWQRSRFFTACLINVSQNKAVCKTYNTTRAIHGQMCYVRFPCVWINAWKTHGFHLILIRQKPCVFHAFILLMENARGTFGHVLRNQKNPFSQFRVWRNYVHIYCIQYIFWPKEEWYFLMQFLLINVNCWQNAM